MPAVTCPFCKAPQPPAGNLYITGIGTFKDTEGVHEVLEVVFHQRRFISGLIVCQCIILVIGAFLLV